MTPSISEVHCVHCGAALTESDLASRWCDSCGKRVPGVPAAVSKRGAATADVDTPDNLRRVPALFWAALAFAQAGTAGLVVLARVT